MLISKKSELRSYSLSFSSTTTIWQNRWVLFGIIIVIIIIHWKEWIQRDKTGIQYSRGKALPAGSTIYPWLLSHTFSKELNRLGWFHTFQMVKLFIKHLKMQSKMTYVLFESASGYSLYEVLEKEEIAGLETQVFFILNIVTV